MKKMRRYFKNKSDATVDHFDSFVGNRGRLVLKTGIWSLLAKICGAVNLFICIPFVLNSLGEQHFGAWATIVSIVTLSTFLDFGLGNGAMNLIAGAKGRSAQVEITKIVHTTYKSILKITLLLCISLFIVPFVSWDKILGLSQVDSSICTISMAVALLSVLLSMPLSIANKIQLGLGHGNKTYKWISFSQLVTTLVVVILAKQGATLPILVAASTLLPISGLLFNTIELLKTVGPSTAPIENNPDLARSIQKEGILFFVLQLSAFLAFNLDLILISSLVGAKEAGEYSIVQKIFSIIPMMLGLIWVPLWPIYREALAKSEYDWVFKIFRKSMILAVFFACSFGLLFALSLEWLTKMWLGQTLIFSAILVCGFVIWHPLESIGTGVSMLLNAASIINYQLIIGLSFAILCFGSKVIVLKYFGINGLPWATLIPYIVINIIPTAIFFPKLRERVCSKKY